MESKFISWAVGATLGIALFVGFLKKDEIPELDNRLEEYLLKENTVLKAEHESTMIFVDSVIKENYEIKKIIIEDEKYISNASNSDIDSLFAEYLSTER